jgi:hypothetical protein
LGINTTVVERWSAVARQLNSSNCDLIERIGWDRSMSAFRSLDCASARTSLLLLEFHRMGHRRFKGRVHVLGNQFWPLAVDNVASEHHQVVDGQSATPAPRFIE